MVHEIRRRIRTFKKILFVLKGYNCQFPSQLQAGQFCEPTARQRPIRLSLRQLAGQRQHGSGAGYFCGSCFQWRRTPSPFSKVLTLVECRVVQALHRRSTTQLPLCHTERRLRPFLPSTAELSSCRCHVLFYLLYFLSALDSLFK